MWSILAAGRGGGERERGKNCGQLSYDEARGRSAGERERYWGSVTRLQRRGKTANRTKKGKTSAPSKHWIYGCCCLFTSSHEDKRIIAQYFPCSPPQSPQPGSPGSPPLFQMWQHSTTPLTRTKLPAPASVYILLVTKRQMTDPITPQWWADCVHIVISALSPLWSILTSAPAIITAQWHLMSLPHCFNLQLVINWDQGIVTNSSDYLRCHIIVLDLSFLSNRPEHSEEPNRTKVNVFS